ncbi:NPCC-domain-containing protein [Hypoxylon sp. NC1633]|nr:NPCC-domain-containing protein [Hypoxylon sp. NC1633]
MSLSTAQTVSTPKKSTPATPVTDSPGTWRHPRLQEIIQRQDATNFTDKNIKRIAINVAVLVACIIVHTYLARMLPPKRTFPQYVWNCGRYAYWTILAIPLLNIGTNLLPLLRAKDDFSDIPLTPGQRRLLGLPQSSAPPTPGSVYSTPPRYSRTPSISGSAGSKRSFSSSPRSPSSNYGSPSAVSGNGGDRNLSIIGTPSSPLLQKAMKGARRSSLGSLGSASPLGVSTGMSLYGGLPDSPSPSPMAGKRSTVGLNNKWLYERGRDRRSSSGNAWLYT